MLYKDNLNLYPLTSILYHSSLNPHSSESIPHLSSSILHAPTSISYPPFSILYPPSFLRHSPAFILHPPSPTVHTPASVLFSPFSILYPPSFMLHSPTFILHPIFFMLQLLFYIHHSQSFIFRPLCFICQPSCSILHHPSSSHLRFHPLSFINLPLLSMDTLSAVHPSFSTCNNFILYFLYQVSSSLREFSTQGGLPSDSSLLGLEFVR